MMPVLPSGGDALRARYILAGLCVLAAALRTLGLAFGLPAIHDTGEAANLNRALALAQDLKPAAFAYPSLYFYLLFIWEAVFFVAGRLGGLFDSLGDFYRAFLVDPSGHALVARALTAICGTAAVIAVYRIGRRLYDRATGLVAAAALGVAPLAVRDAHYIRPDVPGALFVAVAHLALARIVVDARAAARRRYWVVAGILTGVAISTHYYASFLLVTLIAVAAADLRRSRSWRETSTRLSWSVGAASVGFIAGSPFIPFTIAPALAELGAGGGVEHVVTDGRLPAILTYLPALLLDAVGWPLALAALSGMVWAIVNDWRRGLILLSFPAALLASTAAAGVASTGRQLNLILPSIAVAGGFAIARLAARIEHPTRRALLLTLPFVPALFGSMDWGLFLRQADTRTLAKNYIEFSIPAGRSVLVPPNGPDLMPSREALLEGLRANLGSEAKASTTHQLLLGISPYPEPSYRVLYLGEGDLDGEKMYIVPDAFTADEGLAPLHRAGVDYVVLTRTGARNPGLEGLERALAREGRRIAAFSPYKADTTAAERAAAAPFLHEAGAPVHPALERPGPAIEIWAVDGHGRRQWGAPGS